MSHHEERDLHDHEGAPSARRKAAVAAAGHSGDRGEALRGLEDGDAAVRAAALGALLRAGALELGQLSSALSDPSPRVRKRAAELSWRAPATPGEVVALLLAHLGDVDEVTEAICSALGEVGSELAVGELVRVAGEHSDPLCRESAVAALGAIGSPAGLAAILSACSDRPAVRRRAVLALAPFDGPEVDAALERALADRDWQVRQAAEDLTGSRPT